ncbi:MAG TPA: DegT/DnrJ/EryC1/StrS family aminotransferase [Vicinamibacterales bacterium]|nr:DegT/DnrJ/EryC1/StrS family aminotransferase [Vicinamibacterales bacterium]
MKTSVTVPLLDLQAQYQPLRDELLAAVTRVCDSQRFILGPEVDALERELAGALGVAHAVTVSSGTDAILATLMALGVGPGDEVITPTFSFFATAGCVARVGGTPKLVDIDPASYNVDAQAVRAAITSKTKAIVPVHLYGQMADMAALMNVANERGIPVIEDACQAIGALQHGREAGTIGTAGCFSFFPSKNLGAFGDAGLVVTNDDGLAHELKLLRNHGAEPKYFHKRIGGNFRLDALQAAVLRVKLPHLDRWTEARRANARRYDELFADAGLTSKLGLPRELPGFRHIFNQYIVRVPERDRVRGYLTEQGIGTEIYYPVPFHLQECFAALGHRRGDFPHAEEAADSTLALPIYGELTVQQQQAVVSAIREAIRG